MDFGFDQWGKPLTVCVLEDADAVPNPAQKKGLGKNQVLLLAHIRANGPITLTAAIEYMRAADVPRSTYRSVIDGLKLAGLVADIAPGGLTAITTVTNRSFRIVCSFSSGITYRLERTNIHDCSKFVRFEQFRTVSNMCMQIPVASLSV